MSSRSKKVRSAARTQASFGGGDGPDLTVQGSAGVNLPALPSAQLTPVVPSSSSSSVPYHSASISALHLASSLTGAGVRPLIATNPNSVFPSPVSSARKPTARKAPGGAVLKGLDPTITHTHTPPRSAATQAALAQHTLSESKRGQPVLFNPSPPAAPSPASLHGGATGGRVHAQLRKRPVVQASFDVPTNNRAPVEPVGLGVAPSHAPTASQQPERANHGAFPSKRSSGGDSQPEQPLPAAVHTRRPSNQPRRSSQELDHEEAKLSGAEPTTSTSPTASAGVLPADLGEVVVTGEEERSPLPSPSLYTAPPASLFALVATPDAAPTSAQQDPNSNHFQPDTKNTFVHIHSSNSDHGTASGALSSAVAVGAGGTAGAGQGKDSSITPTSALLGGLSPSTLSRIGHHHSTAAGGPGHSLHGGRGHHHQSLSSTPLPLEPGDGTTEGGIFGAKSPSPTLSFFSNSTAADRNAKRRTNLGTSLSMTGPEEETQEQADGEGEDTSQQQQAYPHSHSVAAIARGTGETEESVSHSHSHSHSHSATGLARTSSQPELGTLGRGAGGRVVAGGGGDDISDETGLSQGPSRSVTFSPQIIESSMTVKSPEGDETTLMSHQRTASLDSVQSNSVTSDLPDRAISSSAALEPLVDAVVTDQPQAPPQPIVLNVTLQLLSSSPTDDVATPTAGDPDTSVLPSESLQSLLASLLPRLSDSERSQLSQLSPSLLSHTSVQVGQVRLQREVKDAAVPEPAVDGGEEEAQVDTDEATAAAAESSPETEPLSAPVIPPATTTLSGARTARAKSLFVAKVGPGSSSSGGELSDATSSVTASSVPHASVSVNTRALGTIGGSSMSPTSPSSAGGSSSIINPARRSARFMIVPHADLAASMSRKRVSFMSRSLHALAVDDDVDALTHDLLTNTNTSTTATNANHHPILDRDRSLGATIEDSLATNDPSDLTQNEEQLLLQASLDQDVMLGEDDEFGLSSFDILTTSQAATGASPPPNAVAGSPTPASGSPTTRKHIVPRAGTAHALGAGSANSPTGGERRAASTTAAPGLFVTSNGGAANASDQSSPQSGGPSSRRSSTNVSGTTRSVASPQASTTARAGPGEDTELWAINHSTLLLERLKLEPTISGSEGGTATTNSTDVALIYDKILSHLFRLKKMITRRFYKSKESLTKKLNTITSDTEVVDWISAEFLQDQGAGGGVGGNGQQSSSSTTHSSPAHNRRSTMGAMPMNFSGSQQAQHGRSSSLGLKRAKSHNLQQPSSTVKEEPSATNSSTATPPPLETETKVVEQQDTKAQETQETIEQSPSEPAKDNDTSTSTSTAVSAIATWTSPFSYPLSDEIWNQLLERSSPPLSSIELLLDSTELNTLLNQSSSNWNFDIFLFNRLSSWHSVLTLGMYTFQTHPRLRAFIDEVGMDLKKVYNFLVEIEKGYDWRNPYHNAIHSADVLQNMLIFLSSDLFSTIFTPMDILASVISAIIHDFMHLGRTNNFLIATEHELALKWNDQSILENQSLMETFLILRKEECNFLSCLSRADQISFRSSCVSMVLHTDMRSHITQVNTFEQQVMKHRNSGTWFHSQADRTLLMDFALHVADLGNPAKPLNIGREWASLIMDEYYSQGDQERERGLPISPMMNRNQPTVDVQQYAFINIVVLPLMTQFAEVLNCGVLATPIQNLIANRAYYSNRMQVAKLVQTQAANLIKNGGSLQSMLKPVGARVLKDVVPPSVAATTEAAPETSTSVESTTTAAAEASPENPSAEAGADEVEQPDEALSPEGDAEEAAQQEEAAEETDEPAAEDGELGADDPAAVDARSPIDTEAEAENASYVIGAEEESVPADAEEEIDEDQHAADPDDAAEPDDTADATDIAP